MSASPPSLSLVGCGQLGRSLGRLLRVSGRVVPLEIRTRSLESAREAARFVGVAEALAPGDALQPADVFLLATPDDALEAACADLAAGGAIAEGAIVFHCSGAKSSAILAPARRAGARVASLHPVRSFADPEASARDFAGTWCGVEGDAPAVDWLRGAFEACGARLFDVDPESKLLYHASTVLACNYLVSLMAVAMRVQRAAGVAEEVVPGILGPLVEGTVRNVFERGPAAALTGPVARGEIALVEAQLAALEELDPEAAELYRRLGAVAVGLARERGSASGEALDRLVEILRST